MSTININSKDTVEKGKEITSSGGGGRKENGRDGGNNGGRGDVVKKKICGARVCYQG